MAHSMCVCVCVCVCVVQMFKVAIGEENIIHLSCYKLTAKTHNVAAKSNRYKCNANGSCSAVLARNAVLLMICKIMVDYNYKTSRQQENNEFNYTEYNNNNNMIGHVSHR